MVGGGVQRDPILALSSLLCIRNLPCVAWLQPKELDFLPSDSRRQPLPSCSCVPSSPQTRGCAGPLQAQAALPCLRPECGDGRVAARGSPPETGWCRGVCVTRLETPAAV